jgi:hypothetical protein
MHRILRDFQKIPKSQAFPEIDLQRQPLPVYLAHHDIDLTVFAVFLRLFNG